MPIPNRDSAKPHNKDIKTIQKNTDCPRCGWTMRKGDKAYFTLEYGFVCSVCAIMLQREKK